MPWQTYLTFVIACFVVVIVPGPTVTLIVANSLRHGRRAGMMNVLGNQFGLAVMMAVVLVGLSSIVATMGWWFGWLRLAGALYLVWLGWKLLFPRDTPEMAAPRAPRVGFFAQGLLVALSNPKTLLFFGAFFPQFLDPAGDPARQVLIMGLTAMAVAALSDSTYALLASRAGSLLSRRRSRLLARASGGVLIGGGVWLAFSKSN